MDTPSPYPVARVGPGTLLLVGFYFFNTFLLPAGLLYTTLLTPLFLWFTLQRGAFRFWTVYLMLSGAVAWYHAGTGADMQVYARSYLLLTSVVVFTLWAYFFLLENSDLLGRFFREAALYNTIFTAFALVIIALPGLRSWLWSFVPIHPAVPAIPRLKLLVYEPSFYSFQLAPIFLFFLMAYLFERGQQYLTGLILVGFSLLLSLSFGVLGGLFIAVFIVLLLHIRRLFFRPKVFFLCLVLLTVGASALFLLVQFFPFHPVFVRLDKLAEGNDTSANGRTWEALLLAWQILGESNYLLGAGIGQVKETGARVIVEYYQYEGDWADLVRLPNTVAETMATFGLLGVSVRIIVQVGLFFYTQVYCNYFRLALFVFLFIYQFTGSYLTNIYEYLAWLLVFLPVFPRFDKNQVHKINSGA